MAAKPLEHPWDVLLKGQTERKSNPSIIIQWDFLIPLTTRSIQNQMYSLFEQPECFKTHKPKKPTDEVKP